MKSLIKFSFVFLALLVAANVSAQEGKKKKGRKSKKNKTEEPVVMALNLDDTLTKVSYALGLNIVQNLKEQGLDSIDQKAFAQGIQEAMSGDSTMLTNEESVQVLQAYFTELKEAQTKMASKEGEDFLAANAKKEGVVVTPSGLQYEVIVAAEGAKPLATDQVTVHYTGTFIDGKQFDSSMGKAPVSFPLNGVIAGWTEGLQLMSVGAKYRFYVPYTLAYGPEGRQGAIPPYSVLIFDVELIKIN